MLLSLHGAYFTAQRTPFYKLILRGRAAKYNQRPRSAVHGPRDPKLSQDWISSAGRPVILALAGMALEMGEK